MKNYWFVLGLASLLAAVMACGSENNSPVSYNTDSKLFSLGSGTSGNYTAINSFTVNKGGTIKASAIWTGTTGTLALILNGPGQVGFYARNDGPSPLSLSYDVTTEDISKGSIWTISVINFYSGDANGSVTFTYPN